VGEIAICLKAITFENDISNQLLEWLLISQEQGFGAVYIPIYKDLHENAMKVLKCVNNIIFYLNTHTLTCCSYFSNEEFVNITRIIYQSDSFQPEAHANDPYELHRRMQHVTRNDCFYRLVANCTYAFNLPIELIRNFPKWDFFSMHDIDEVILPIYQYHIGSFLNYVENNYPMFDQIYISQYLFVNENQPANIVDCKRASKKRPRRRRHKREALDGKLTFLNQFNRYSRGIKGWKHLIR